MLAITGTLLAGLAVIGVAFELTWPSAILGAIAYWMISHAA
jgi:hypothetical protein